MIFELFSKKCSVRKIIRKNKHRRYITISNARSKHTKLKLIQSLNLYKSCKFLEFEDMVSEGFCDLYAVVAAVALIY